MKVIEVAKKYIGVKESPPNSNKVIFNDWFYGKTDYPNTAAWCGTFISFCFNEAGIPLGVIDYLKGYAGCPYAVANVHKWGKIIPKEQAQPGDIVFYAWNKPGQYEHTGLFVRDTGNNTFEAIEGNTSLGNDSNGGEVMLRQRRYSVATFVRPNVIK